jgi:hypothetical protein
VAEPAGQGGLRAELVRRVRAQGTSCAEMGSPLYAVLLDRVADDLLEAGPTAAVLEGHDGDPPRSALALRLMGAVHRLVLDRRAPELAMFYPSVGGTAEGAGAWPAFRRVLVEHASELRPLLDQPPQTNEVGRAASLVGGLGHVVDRWPLPVRLFEIGASAGLNLRADHFRLESAGRDGVGPVDSPVVLGDAWLGGRPPATAPLRILERQGCDIAPVDPLSQEGRLRLTSYVWPDQASRLARLRGALQVAAQVPATVVRRSASDFLVDLRLQPDAATVVWHSVMWQYLDPAERVSIEQRLDDLGHTASAKSPLAHLRLEPRRRTPSSPIEFLVMLRTWPGGDERILGSAPGHGLPTTWH